MLFVKIHNNLESFLITLIPLQQLASFSKLHHSFRIHVLQEHIHLYVLVVLLHQNPGVALNVGIRELLLLLCLLNLWCSIEIRSAGAGGSEGLAAHHTHADRSGRVAAHHAHHRRVHTAPSAHHALILHHHFGSQLGHIRLETHGLSVSLVVVLIHWLHLRRSFSKFLITMSK